MLPIDAKVISVDDHIIEPGHLWIDRLPSRYGDRIPRLVHEEDGDYWEYADERVAVQKLSMIAGTSPAEWEDGVGRLSDARPGVYDPVARLSDMDEDGIWAEMCFPNYARFAGHRFLQGNDRTLALACVQAWNDFSLDEWCAAAPDRYIPLSILPLWDVNLAVAEVERTAAKGTRAIAFSEDPAQLGLPSIYTGYWDPLFSAIQDADLVLCQHIGSSSQLAKQAYSPDSPVPAWVTLVGVNSMFAAVDWLFSGALQRFPKLRIALSEGGAGWAGYLMERADYVWDLRKFYTDVDADVPPSRLFRKHVGLCFLKDEVAIAARHDIGLSNLMFESDYPHADSVFPHSRKVLEESLTDVPDDEAQLIVEGNARRMFNFP